MNGFFKTLGETPSSLASITAAIIAGSVALFTVAITQFVTHRKARAQFLLPKLEELYLLLNELAASNANNFKILYLALQGDASAKKKLNEIDDLDLYGHRRAKEIIMYVRLYFPKLSRIHQALFASEKALNDLIFRVKSRNMPEEKDLLLAVGRVSNRIMLMEREIVENRDFHIRDRFLKYVYKAATDEEIMFVPKPPEGPIMG